MKRVLWWGVLAAGPLVLAGVWAGVGTGFAIGGMARVVAYYLGQMLFPVAGLFALPICALVAWRDKERRLFAAIIALWGLISLLPVLMLLGLWAPRYPGSLESVTPAATVRLPLDGPIVVGWGGDTVAANYHAVTPDQRWAYDLLVEPAAHGGTALSDYGCYGLDVLAPTSGVIAIVHDGEPDQDPSTFVPNPTAPAGNHVVIELETHTYLLLAHLIPGSIAVSEGERVEEGQVLGKCGNSGNTSEPHVHIHHVRQRPETIGLGEGLPLYFRGHTGQPMPTGGIEVDGDDQVHFTGDRIQHRG